MTVATRIEEAVINKICEHKGDMPSKHIRIAEMIIRRQARRQNKLLECMKSDDELSKKKKELYEKSTDLYNKYKNGQLKFASATHTLTMHLECIIEDMIILIKNSDLSEIEKAIQLIDLEVKSC